MELDSGRLLTKKPNHGLVQTQTFSFTHYRPAPTPHKHNISITFWRYWKYEDLENRKLAHGFLIQPWQQIEKFHPLELLTYFSFYYSIMNRTSVTSWLLIANKRHVSRSEDSAHK